MPNPEQSEPPIRHVWRVVDSDGQSNWEVVPAPTLEEKLAYWTSLVDRGVAHAGKEVVKIQEQIDAQNQQ